MKKELLTFWCILLLILSCEKTHEDITVTSVSIGQASAEMLIGETVQLSASVQPNNATDKSVAWASSKQSVATVSKNGLVTAIAEGSSIITASAGGKSAICTVVVSKGIVLVTSITLDKESLELVEGDTATLNATVKPDDATDKTVSWSSSNATVASVDSGKVTAIKEGEATITAKAGDKTAECKLRVAKKVIAVTSIELNKTILDLKKGESETLTATVKPDDATDKTVTWSSSNTNIATVDSNGKVTAIGGGNATITAKVGDKQATCSITVTVPIQTIALDNTTVTLEEGESVTLSANITPDDATDKTITWYSSDESIATVDATGKITAIAKGEVEIKVSANDGSGVFASCFVTVKKPIPAGAIDLGLSVLWATCNLCETGFVDSPEKVGDYYAWGETGPYYESGYSLSYVPIWKEGKTTGYSWTSYSLCDNSGTALTKYNTHSACGTVDNKTVLEESDDVAHVNLGGSWRIPTFEEWRELLTNCSMTSTVQNGVEGVCFTSKKNGNSIFLPITGYREDTSLYSINSNVWTGDGYYWSSNLYFVEDLANDPTESWILYFDPYAFWNSCIRSVFRYRGCIIRPVTD